MKATNQTVQRSFNRSLVLQKLRQESRISRVDLSRALGLEKSSISAITGELIAAGLVHETELGEASVSGGRKPVFLELQARFCCFLGLEIQPTRYHAVILDLNGRLLHEVRGQHSDLDQPFETKLQGLFDQLDPVVRGLDLPLAAICIGIPGLVNPHTGMVTRSVPHALEDWDFSGFGNPWQVPAFIENDANCCAWATLLDGDPTNGGDFLAILLELQDRNPLTAPEAGVSVGLGVVLNGEVHYGHHFDAGEFRSLFWRQGLRSQTGIPDRDLAGIAHNPAIMDRYLAEILANLIPVCAVLAPERIILCGEAGRAFDRIPGLLAGPLADTWLARTEIAQRLQCSRRDAEVVAVGAAARLIMTLFNSRSLSKSASPHELDWDGLLRRFGQVKPG